MALLTNIGQYTISIVDINGTPYSIGPGTNTTISSALLLPSSFSAFVANGTLTVSSYTSPASGVTVDRVPVVTTYFCKTAFTGASVGDVITSTQVVDVTGTPASVSVIWRNQTTALDLGSTPSSANLTLNGSQLPSSTVSSAAYEASHVVKASAGVLRGITGFNSKGTAQFIQVFDSATVPADTAVPAIVIYAAATSNFSYVAPILGRPFVNGIAVSNSSTGPTKTIGSADCWFDAQYI